MFAGITLFSNIIQMLLHSQMLHVENRSIELMFLNGKIKDYATAMETYASNEMIS